MEEKFFKAQKKIMFQALNQTIGLVYTNSIQTARNAYIKILGPIEDIPPTVDGMCAYDDFGTVVVFIQTNASLGVISHEAYHAVCATFRNIGVEIHDEEIMAYHIGYLVDEIMVHIRKTNDKLDKKLEQEEQNGQNNI